MPEAAGAPPQQRPDDAWAWVEIEWTVLAAGERAPSAPEDTAVTPYVARTRGFAPGQPRIGDVVEVTTAVGRRLRGQVVRLRPGHDHSFGRPLPPWLQMQRSIREALAEE